MIVFKAFWKILNKNKMMIIIYTVILVIFGVSNMKTNGNTMNFNAVKPDILIINNDEEKVITKNFIKYLEKNSNVKNLANNEDAINDAIFYREVNYVIYIPEKFNDDIMEGKNPEIKVKSTKDYNSSYAEMLVSKYLKLVNNYATQIHKEEDLVKAIDETLEKQVEIEVTTKLDTNSLQKFAEYYNFESYSLLACLILIIGIVLNTFNKENIKKRTVISSINYKKYNLILLCSNCCYAILLWLLYVIISIICLKDIMLSKIGLIFILNSFVFTVCVTTLSFLIGNIVNNKDALSGISNVISLGSSFLCGAFVPVEWLPDFVLKIAHFIPTYYFINTNNRLASLENFSVSSLKPIINNTIIMIGFIVLFIILTNIVTKKKRKI